MCLSLLYSAASVTEFLTLFLRPRAGPPSDCSLDLVSCLYLFFAPWLISVLRIHILFGWWCLYVLMPGQGSVTRTSASGGICKITTISSASSSLTFISLLDLVCSVELITFKKLDSFGCVCVRALVRFVWRLLEKWNLQSMSSSGRDAFGEMRKQGLPSNPMR